MDLVASSKRLDVGLSNATPTFSDFHDLLSNTQFVFLVIFSGVCHYTAFIISSLAVGESVSVLLFPFVALKFLFTVPFNAIAEFLRRRRQRHIFVGIDYQEDGAIIDSLEVMNEPSKGVLNL